MPAPRSSVEQQILRYYESGQEAERLESPFSRWEKVRTLDLLDRFLPPAPALILALAAPLVRMLFRAAVDQHALGSFQVGDARAIPCKDGAADAVLFFGPLYQLTDSSERLKGICEARRVLRVGGGCWRWQSRVSPQTAAQRNWESRLLCYRLLSSSRPVEDGANRRKISEPDTVLDRGAALDGIRSVTAKQREELMATASGHIMGIATKPND